MFALCCTTPALCELEGTYTKPAGSSEELRRRIIRADCSTLLDSSSACLTAVGTYPVFSRARTPPCQARVVGNHMLATVPRCTRLERGLVRERCSLLSGSVYLLSEGEGRADSQAIKPTSAAPPMASIGSRVAMMDLLMTPEQTSSRAAKMTALTNDRPIAE